MKKALTENITRYDDKMMVRLNGKTFKAMGIGVLIAALPTILLYVTVGSIPALLVGVMLIVATVVLRMGTLQGMPLTTYLGDLLRILFCPGTRRKPYTHEDSPARLCIRLDADTKENERRK